MKNLFEVTALNGEYAITAIDGDNRNPQGWCRFTNPEEAGPKFLDELYDECKSLNTLTLNLTKETALEGYGTIITVNADEGMDSLLISSPVCIEQRVAALMEIAKCHTHPRFKRVLIEAHTPLSRPLRLALTAAGYFPCIYTPADEPLISVMEALVLLQVLEANVDDMPKSMANLTTSDLTEDVLNTIRTGTIPSWFDVNSAYFLRKACYVLTCVITTNGPMAAEAELIRVAIKRVL